MLQETEQYKINWLRKQSFRVKMNCVDPSDFVSWLEQNLEEKVWSMSANVEQSQHTFFFESPQDASTFREHFINDSRTVDIN